MYIPIFRALPAALSTIWVILGLTIEISGWELSDGAYRSVLKELMKRGQEFPCNLRRLGISRVRRSVNRSLGTTANYSRGLYL